MINMRELIALPGLHFWIYKLEGALALTHFILGQLPRRYTISKHDFAGIQEMEEGTHSKMMVDLGGHPKTFSTTLSRELSVVFLRIDGTLDMEYHYGSDSREVLSDGFGPWTIESYGARPVDQQTHSTGPPAVASHGNFLTTDLHIPAPQRAWEFSQGTSPDTQETPPDILETPPDTHETLPATQKTSLYTHATRSASYQNCLLDSDFPYDPPSTRKRQYGS
jgi:hypothetical protein